MKTTAKTQGSACPEALLPAREFLYLTNTITHNALCAGDAYKKLMNTLLGVSDAVVKQYSAWPFQPYRF